MIAIIGGSGLTRLPEMNITHRRIVRTMLYQAQLHRIFEASDLASAATIFIQKQPNIVILDWDLPDAGSVKCLASIRSFRTSPFAKAPVLVMMERAEHVVDALRAEMSNLREE